MLYVVFGKYRLSEVKLQVQRVIHSRLERTREGPGLCYARGPWVRWNKPFRIIWAIVV